MENKYVKVLMIEPMKYPTVSYLDSSMQGLRNAVSIDAIDVGNVRAKKINKDVYIIFNSDMFFAGLEGNRRVGNDIIAGIFYVLGVDKSYHPRSLTKEELIQYANLFWEPEIFDDGELVQANLDSMLFREIV